MDRPSPREWWTRKRSAEESGRAGCASEGENDSTKWHSQSGARGPSCRGDSTRRERRARRAGKERWPWTACQWREKEASEAPGSWWGGRARRRGKRRAEGATTRRILGTAATRRVRRASRTAACCDGERGEAKTMRAEMMFFSRRGSMCSRVTSESSRAAPSTALRYLRSSQIQIAKANSANATKTSAQKMSWQRRLVIKYIKIKK